MFVPKPVEPRELVTTIVDLVALNSRGTAGHRLFIDNNAAALAAAEGSQWQSATQPLATIKKTSAS